MSDPMVLCQLSFLPAISTLAQVAIFLALLSVLVIFHEFGHFVMAKRAGVTVTDFAVGFGPSLFSLRRGDTTYRVNLLPLGGYCKMVGEDMADTGPSDPGNFQRKSLAKRFGIIASGPIFNLFLAAGIFAFLGTVIGIPTGITTIVQSVKAKTPAAAAGLTPGDVIVALDGKPVQGGDDMINYIHGHPGKMIAVDVQHDGIARHLQIRAQRKKQGDEFVGQFGFVPRQVVEHKPVIQAILWGFGQVGATAALQFVGITQAIRNHDSSVISGPVGIAHVVISAEQFGVYPVLELMARISVVLGLFNLLPLPALDGGRLAFLAAELLRGRPVDPEKEGLVHLTGFALLMVFVVFVTYHDIVQWVNGKGGL